MSNYQYYAFRAIDSRLTEGHVRLLRKLSSRATITLTSFENTYNWGTFRGNPRDMLARYFDAHVYATDSGAFSFMLRLPHSALPMDEVAPFASVGVFEWWTTDEYVILEWRIDDKYDDEYYVDYDEDRVQSRAWIDLLAPIRDELVRGDLRSLYIGWLRSVQNSASDELIDEGRRENSDHLQDGGEDGGVHPHAPNIPAGMRSLTASQRELCASMQLSRYLVEAAAALNPEPAQPAALQGNIAEWVANLPVEEARTCLTQLITEDGSAVQTELRSRYCRSVNARKVGARGKPTAHNPASAQLLVLAYKLEEESDRREAERKEKLRRTKLAAMVPQFGSLWQAADAAATRGTTGGYNKAVSILIDLRDAHEQAGRHEVFDLALGAFWLKHGGRRPLKSRLLAARLEAAKLF